MLDELRTLHVALPEAWTPEESPVAAPPTPSLVRAGIRLTTAWRGSRADDGSAVVLYRARTTRGAVRTLERQLATVAGAARLNGRLTWAVGSGSWVSLNFLQPATAANGPALLWSSHLPVATAPQRMGELLDAAERTAWQRTAPTGA